MKIKIKSPNGPDREIEISPAMEKHWSIPINHAQTILDQINRGMYARWFEGKSGLRVIDFGANVGLTGKYFAPACKLLQLVEPTPSHFELLQELIEADKTQCKTQLHRFALSGKEEKVIFMTGHSTENKITSAEGYGNGKIEVQAYPLSWYIGKSKQIVDFIKCDIEGAEIFALSQEQIDLSKGKVRAFFVECHPSNNYGMEGCVVELTNRFKNAGYAVEQIDYQTFIATYDC